MMHAVTPVEHLDDSDRLQPDAGDHPVQPRPDPRGAIGHEGHHIRPGGPSRCRWNATNSIKASGPWRVPSMTGRLPLTIRPFLSSSKRITTLGSRHSMRNFFRFRLPPTFTVSTTVRTRTRPPSIPTPILLPANSPPAGASPRRKGEQIPRSGRQHLGPQFAGDPTDGFLVEFQAATCQLRPRLFDRQETDLSADFRLNVGTATLAEPIGGQFRVESTPLGAAPLAGPSSRRAIQGHHRDRQAPQESHDQGALFFSTRRNRTSAAARTV